MGNTATLERVCVGWHFLPHLLIFFFFRFSHVSEVLGLDVSAKICTETILKAFTFSFAFCLAFL